MAFSWLSIAVSLLLQNAISASFIYLSNSSTSMVTSTSSFHLYKPPLTETMHSSSKEASLRAFLSLYARFLRAPTGLSVSSSTCHIASEISSIQTPLFLFIARYTNSFSSFSDLHAPSWTEVMSFPTVKLPKVFNLII